MKKFKSMEELKRSALTSGASAQIGDERFNVGREKAEPKPALREVPASIPMVHAPIVEPELVAPPAPQEVKVQVDTGPMAWAISKAMADGLADLIKTMGQVERPAPQSAALTAPCGWVFEVVRDARGRLQQVIANPKI